MTLESISLETRRHSLIGIQESPTISCMTDFCPDAREKTVYRSRNGMDLSRGLTLGVGPPYLMSARNGKVFHLLNPITAHFLSKAKGVTQSG